ncbi:hypothetical protein PVA44_01455 [Entomospira nematocerorum]|uniref:Uncharacterized protein n=1 Tax=Entomospira nematocerorum TaxID=2719987 RepID=A0A968GCG4_9SPIO|nr:hypothetical protein [Entomospira nematocera]NIZ47300.1 hypothetical protein [Entomospira nematocera]WDI34158.1 hypothetical protein PVA44_01455 [Entomospira nematocera]
MKNVLILGIALFVVWGCKPADQTQDAVDAVHTEHANQTVTETQHQAESKTKMIDVAVGDMTKQVELDFDATRHFIVMIGSDTIESLRHTMQEVGTWGEKEAAVHHLVDNDDHDFHYNVLTHTTSVAYTDESYKKMLIEQLQREHHSGFKLISEGNDFVEFEDDTNVYYHGFTLSKIAPTAEVYGGETIVREFIGYSDKEHYSDYRESYVNTFEQNKENFVAMDKTLGYSPMNF